MQNFWTMKCQWPCMLLFFAIAMTMFSLYGSVILDCPKSARPTDKTIDFTCSVLKNGSLKILVDDRPVNIYINQKTGDVIDQSGINSTILVRNQSLTMVSVQVVVDGGTNNYTIQCKDTMNAADRDSCFIQIVNCPPLTNYTVRQLNKLLRIEMNHSDDSIGNDDVMITISSKIQSIFSRTILANTKTGAVDFDDLTFGEYIINVTVLGCHSNTVMIDFVGGVPELKEFSIEVDMIKKRIHLKGDIEENGPLIDRVIISFPNNNVVIVHPKSMFDYTFNSLQTSVVMVTPANSYGNGTTLTKNIIIPTNISLDTTNTSSWLLCIKGINQQFLRSYKIYYNDTISVNGTFTAINNTCDRVVANGFSNINTNNNTTITLHIRVDTTTMISYYINAEIINRHNIPTIGPPSHSGSIATIATSSLLWLILGGLLLSYLIS